MREGRLSIPPFEVTVVYAIDTRPSMPTPLATQPISFEATVPAAARGLDSFVSALRLDLRQTLEPPPKGLAVGGALRRTVTIEAEGAFGMMLPPLPAPTIAGLSAYPDPPQVEDHGGERGEARVARRVESVAYRLEREGDYELPGIEVAWWDLGAKQMRRARLAAVAFSVAPAPARADEIPLPPETEAVAPAQPALSPPGGPPRRLDRPGGDRSWPSWPGCFGRSRAASFGPGPAWQRPAGAARTRSPPGSAACAARRQGVTPRRRTARCSAGPSAWARPGRSGHSSPELAMRNWPRRSAASAESLYGREPGRRLDRDPARPPPGGGAAPCPAGRSGPRGCRSAGPLVRGGGARRPRPEGGADGTQGACRERKKRKAEENMRKTRRPFSAPLAALAVLALGLMLWAPAGAHAQTQPPKKPNILVIFGDDIGVWNVSAYHRGMMGGRTPSLDRLATEGALFTDYYGQQSCTAGRAAFILGQSPFRTGLLKVGMPGAKQGIQAKDPTIAELLKPLGYATAQAGKNHLGDLDEMLPTNHGFDEFFGNLYHLNAEEEPEDPDYPKNPEFRKRFAPRGAIRSSADGKIEDTGPITRKRMETVEEEFLAFSLDFIDRSVKAGKPFFLWHNSTRMHIWTRLAPKWTNKSGYGLYADGMMELDDVVGRLLAKLDDSRHRRQHDRRVHDRQRRGDLLLARRGQHAVSRREGDDLGGRHARAVPSSGGPASSSPARSTTRSWRTRTGCPRCSRPRATRT